MYYVLFARLYLLGICPKGAGTDKEVSAQDGHYGTQ